MEIRHYQQQALDNIFKHDRCLVKMFCGTGKSLILTETLLQLKSNISVIVFPSLSLIQQYSSEYIHRFNAYNVINISSEKLEFHTTTHSAKIDAFLSLPDPKLVLVTYQSYEVLIRALKGRTIAACFDEAHHVVSPEYQKLIFDPSHYERQVFFTATPRNENGIVMYDRNHPELNMCGPLAFDYTFLDGLNDGYLNGFEICVDMFSQNSNASMYDVIARAVLRHGKNRILTFHSGVNGEKNTSVWKFVDPDEFQTAFDRVVEKEFPDKRGLYTKITMRGMDGETPSEQRKRWLHEMDKSPLHEIYLIASCETIGEGVDTKHANMVVFVDPKTSNIKIIQNIGRVLRLNRESSYSVVLVPVYVNLENYASANGDPVLQDELIKEQMRSERGDYAPIMNVLAALNQEDPELYEMCLTFPNKAHKLHSLQQQGFDVDEEIEYSPDEVSTLRSAGTPLELHTDETIVRINEKEGAGEEPPLKRIKPNELVRLYYDDDVYRPIITDDDDNRPIQPPKKRISLSMHQDDDVQILWRVKEFDAEKFGSIVLECSVSWNVINWHKTHKEACEYMDTNHKRPSQHVEATRKLGSWISKQLINYNKGDQIMKDQEIRKVWEETLQKYDEYLCDATEQWHNTHKQLCEYMDANQQRPINGNEETQKLASWISTQKNNYKNGINIMKDPKIRKVWEDTLQKYDEYLFDATEQWHKMHKEVCQYMDDKKKRPSTIDKIPEIKTLGRWVHHQLNNYKNDINIMKDPKIRKVWEETLQKYNKYLCDAFELWTEQWHKTHKEACEYMDTNHKRPSHRDKQTKKLASWISNQLTRYKNGIMKDPEIRKVWEETLRKYPFLQSKIKTYADLSEEERRLICEKHLKQHLEKGYHSTNPDDKDIINKVFASDVLPGKVVFLDHVEFKTAYALLERGIKPEHMVIPQRQDNFEVMASHELFGSSVVLGEFNDVLESVLQTCKVAGIYADYCSTLEKDGIPFVDLVCKYKSSCENAVVGVTITLRNPEGVRYAGQDIQMMEKKLCRAFPTSENLFYKYAVVPDDGPYTYGGGAPMATWMIKL